MKVFLSIVGFLFAACIPSLSLTDDGSFNKRFICIAEKSTGFKYMNGEWADVSFKTDEKYLLRPRSKDDTFVPDDKDYVVVPFGSDYVLAHCKSNNLKNYGVAHCEGLGTQFKFNAERKRFLRSYVAGYFTNQKDTESDTPFLEIGECSRL
jgi:hypothetical protein